MPLADEADLLRRVVAGDEVATTELVRHYEARALRLAMGMLRDRERAEDATQEAFVRALAEIRRMRPGVSFGTWLYRCVVWACRDAGRRQRRWSRTLALEASAASEFDAVDSRLDTLALLGRIPSRYREVLLLKFYAGLGEQEIASALGCRLGTVKSRTNRALKQLERVMTRAGVSTNSSALAEASNERD